MYRFSELAIQYTIEQLFAFAGIAEEIALENHLEEENPYTIVYLGSKKIRFCLLQENDIQILLDGKLAHIHSTGLCGADIPFFGAMETLASQDTDSLAIHADIVTLSFILLSRYEEWISDQHDIHGRFEYRNSLACKYNFIEIPLVDEYALWLRKTIQSFIPDLEIRQRVSSLIPTHDIDLLYRFDNQFRNNCRSIIGGDLIKNRSIRLAISSWKEWQRALLNRYEDPYLQSIRELCHSEQQLQLSPIVFIKAQHWGEEDATYDIDDPHLSHLLQELKSQKISIGLHGSYSSSIQRDRLAEEKVRLETIAGMPITTIRQHFLRFDIHQTVAQWNALQIEHDYTLGFAEREGFRCGTCHPYPLYDHAIDCQTSVIEHPLIAMDGTLIEYRKLNKDQASDQLHKLCQRCRAVEGDMVILWHNHTTSRQYSTYFQDAYWKLLQQ